MAFVQSRFSRKWVLGSVLALAALSSLTCAGIAAKTESPEKAKSPAWTPSFRKVFIVVLENERREDTISKPFFKKFADEGVYFKNFFAITHPSYPNYMAMVGGSTFGILTDYQITVDKSHLGDLLEAKGLSWRVYAEGYPGGERRKSAKFKNCFLKSGYGDYARKHVPFLSFKNVQDNPARCANIVSAKELQGDIENDRLADFTMYIPDNKNNGHDTGVGYADKAMEKTFGPLLKDERFTRDMLFVMTFDEDDYRARNNIYTVFWGPSVVAGTVDETKYTLYDLLRTVEDAFGLETLGRNDEKAKRIIGVWR